MQRRFDSRFFLIGSLSSAFALGASTYYLESLFSGYAHQVARERVSESLRWAKPVLEKLFHDAQSTAHGMVRAGTLSERVAGGLVSVFKIGVGKTEQLYVDQSYLDRFGMSADQYLEKRGLSQSELGERIAQGPHWANFSSITQVPTISFVIPHESPHDGTLWVVDFNVDPFLAPFSTAGWQELAVIDASYRVLLHPKRTLFLNADPWSEWASTDLSKSDFATELPMGSKKKAFLVFRSTFPVLQDFESRIRLLGGLFFSVLVVCFGFLSLRRKDLETKASDVVFERVTELQAIHAQDERSMEVLGKITLGWASTYQTKGWDGLQSELLREVGNEKRLIEEDLENLLVITEHWKQAHAHRATALEELIRGISDQKKV